MLRHAVNTFTSLRRRKPSDSFVHTIAAQNEATASNIMSKYFSSSPCCAPSYAWRIVHGPCAFVRSASRYRASLACRNAFSKAGLSWHLQVFMVVAVGGPRRRTTRDWTRRWIGSRQPLSLLALYTQHSSQPYLRVSLPPKCQSRSRPARMARHC